MTNFYRMTVEAWINGEKFYSNSEIVLIADEKATDYTATYSNNIQDFVSNVCRLTDVMRGETLFTKRPFVWVWDQPSHSARRFIDEMKECSIKFSYEKWNHTPSFNELCKYPADKVIEYLKERGITACPILK